MIITLRVLLSLWAQSAEQTSDAGLEALRRGEFPFREAGGPELLLRCLQAGGSDGRWGEGGSHWICSSSLFLGGYVGVTLAPEFWDVAARRQPDKCISYPSDVQKTVIGF